MKTFFKNIWTLLTSKRFKSFYWRTGMMALAGIVTLLANSTANLGLPSTVTVVLGLWLGEISKALNSKIPVDTEAAVV